MLLGHCLALLVQYHEKAEITLIIYSYISTEYERYILSIHCNRSSTLRWHHSSSLNFWVLRARCDKNKYKKTLTTMLISAKNWCRECIGLLLNILLMTVGPEVIRLCVEGGKKVKILPSLFFSMLAFIHYHSRLLTH